MPIQIASVVFGDNDGYTTITLEDPVGTMLMVEIHNPQVAVVPDALSVSVSEALGPEDLVFTVRGPGLPPAGTEVLRHEPDSTGSLELISVPVPALTSIGNFTLVVSQGEAEGLAPFVVLNPYVPPPARKGPDAPPVQVPGAIQLNGTRRWVLQDVMPGGLGSWIMPMNPVNMGSPAFSRELSVKKTTASVQQGGRFHIYEDAFTPVPWEFSGYLPSDEMRDRLEAYANLNRRFYLHDHRGRAWKVVFESLELEPRLTQWWNGEMTHEGHDYSATVAVLEREWTAV